MTANERTVSERTAMSEISSAVWKIEFQTEARAVPFFSAALAEALGEDVPIATVGDEGDPIWRIEAFHPGQPDRDLLGKVMGAIARALNLARPVVTLTELEERDWVADNQRTFQPISVGRFFIHPSYHAGGVPRGMIGIRIDPGMAFGTGTHPTTQGCLQAIDMLAKRRKAFERALDMGCGSGILAIALSKVSKRRVLAMDNDPQAVETALENVRLNGCDERVIVAQSEGFANPSIRARAPYEVIVANILAGPLIAMAQDVAAYLADRGYVVLSGLLAGQQDEVLEAYRAQGFTLWRALESGEWRTLILKG